MDESKVLAAIKTTSLRRVVEHLLAGDTGLSLTTFAGKPRQLAHHAARHRAAVIVADYGLLGDDPAHTIAIIRNANPQAKLVLIVPFDWRRARAGEFRADACLRKCTIARLLAPTVRKLARRGAPQQSGGIQ